MKSFICLLLLWPALAQALDITACEGSVLQRRLALAEAAETAEAWISTHPQSTDFCQAYTENSGRAVPRLLKGRLECESEESEIVYYVCEAGRSRTSDEDDHVTMVLESCSYSLAKKKLACENNSVVTTLDQ